MSTAIESKEAKLTDVDDTKAATIAALTTQTPTAVVVKNDEEKSFDLAWRHAKALASSQLIPEAFRNRPADCMIAFNMSKRLNVEPMMILQNLYIVHGNPSFSAKFMVACVNACGRFTSLQYEFKDKGGPDMECFAHANDIRTGERIIGPTVSMKMAKGEGWIDKKGSKWKTMPELMITYRAAAFFCRTIAPEILMGFQTTEEVRDIAPSSNATRPEARSAMDALIGVKDVTPTGDDAADVIEPNILDPNAEPPDDYDSDSNNEKGGE